MSIRKTSVYKKWSVGLRYSRARSRIQIRIKRLEEGNPGDHRFLGDILELKIDYGPGYRVYYKDTGKEIIILLCGGDRSTQDADIIRAKQIAALLLEEED
jgi:putative addiction module killer protein